MKIYAILFGILLFAPPIAEPYSVSTQRSKEEIWRRMMQFFNQNDLSVKVVDKNAGMLQSEKFGIGSYCNAEGMGDTSAWALFNRVPDEAYLRYPHTMHTELRIWVDVQADKNWISIQLIQLTAQGTDNFHQPLDYKIRSTHVLERQIAQYLLNNDPPLQLALDPPHAFFTEPQAQADKRKADLARMKFQKDSLRAAFRDSMRKNYSEADLEAMSAAGQSVQQKKNEGTGNFWTTVLALLGLGLLLILKIKEYDPE